jgi:hypothetical protein
LGGIHYGSGFEAASRNNIRSDKVSGTNTANLGDERLMITAGIKVRTHKRSSSVGIKAVYRNGIRAFFE